MPKGPKRSILAHIAIRHPKHKRIACGKFGGLMRSTILLLVAICVAPLWRAGAHEYAQDAAGRASKRDVTTDQRPASQNSLNDEEAHPEIAALVDRSGACAEFRVRASRGNDGAETKHIEKCH